MDIQNSILEKISGTEQWNSADRLKEAEKARTMLHNRFVLQSMDTIIEIAEEECEIVLRVIFTGEHNPLNTVRNLKKLFKMFPPVWQGYPVEYEANVTVKAGSSWRLSLSQGQRSQAE